jgi:hypothetical protein
MDERISICASSDKDEAAQRASKMRTKRSLILTHMQVRCLPAPLGVRIERARGTNGRWAQHSTAGAAAHAGTCARTES